MSIIYFYAGNTPMSRNGQIQFHGTITSDSDPAEVIGEVIDRKTDELGVKRVVLTAFNRITH